MPAGIKRLVHSYLLRSMKKARYQTRGHRPLRPRGPALLPLHIADPPLSGSRRPPDPQVAPRREARARRACPGRISRAWRSSRAISRCARRRPSVSTIVSRRCDSPARRSGEAFYGDRDRRDPGRRVRRVGRDSHSTGSCREDHWGGITGSIRRISGSLRRTGEAGSR